MLAVESNAKRGRRGGLRIRREFMRGQERRGRDRAVSWKGFNRGTEADYFVLVTVAPNIKGTHSIFSVASVWGLEHHHPIMSML